MADVGDVAEALGAEPGELQFLDGLSDPERDVLLAAIEEAGRTRDRELRQAVDDALAFVPRPLRGRIVRILGGRRRG